MLILDDLHWADDASLLLLQFLARTVNQSRTVIIGGYRSSEAVDGEPLDPSSLG